MMWWILRRVAQLLQRLVRLEARVLLAVVLDSREPGDAGALRLVFLLGAINKIVIDVVLLQLRLLLLRPPAPVRAVHLEVFLPPACSTSSPRWWPAAAWPARVFKLIDGCVHRPVKPSKCVVGHVGGEEEGFGPAPQKGAQRGAMVEHRSCEPFVTP